MKNRHKILLIDDSSVNNLLLQTILEDEGYQVEVAFNGKEGLEKISLGMPNLVVLDIMMPKMDGFEVLEKILANPETSHIPVIMLTAKKDSIDEERARRIGAADYMTKPVDIEYTLKQIRKTLNQ